MGRFRMSKDILMTIDTQDQHLTTTAIQTELCTHIEIYTDGSCIGNPGYGGHAFVMLRINGLGEILKQEERSKSVREITTNIRMEMTACCEALEALGCVTDESITLYADLQLISNTMSRDLKTWKAKGWKLASGKTPKNLDLWLRLEAATEGRNVTFAHVKGHSGILHNERADGLANAAARSATF